MPAARGFFVDALNVEILTTIKKKIFFSNPSRMHPSQFVRVADLPSECRDPGDGRSATARAGGAPNHEFIWRYLASMGSCDETSVEEFQTARNFKVKFIEISPEIP